MSWIKIDVNIYNHPNTCLLAKVLGVNHWEAGMLLIRVWCWARMYCDTGYINKYDADLIEERIGYKGATSLIKAMRETRWITPEGWLKEWIYWGGAEIYSRYLKDRVTYSKYEEMYKYYTTQGVPEIPRESQESPENPIEERRGEEIRGEEIRGEKRRRDKREKSLSRFNGIREEFEKIRLEWNTMAKANDLRECIQATESRLEGFSERIKDPKFIQEFNKILSIISKTPFLLGANNRNWKADLDFLILRRDSWVKILEGKYGELRRESHNAKRAEIPEA